MLIPELLQAAAQAYPEKTALAFQGERVSFGDLATKSDRIAACLHSLGIGKGDRVAILHENGLQPMFFFWGVLKCGAQTVDIPLLSPRQTVEDILAESRPKAMLISSRQSQKLFQGNARPMVPQILFGDCADQIPEVSGQSFHSIQDVVAEPAQCLSPPACRSTEVAMVVYTSGSSGRPKGVMLSHDNLISNISAANAMMRLDASNSLLLVVPLHFIHGRMQILLHAMIAGTVFISEGFHFPRQVLSELIDNRVSGFSGVPYHFRSLLGNNRLKETALPHLRYVVITGGALATAELEDLARALPEVGINVCYGQTEASPRVTHLLPAELHSKPGSSGRPLPGVRVEVVGEDGSELPAGEMGEVVVSGPNVMRGYVSGDEAALKAIDEQGRLHTGDLGTMDEEGHLFLVGRKSDMIKTAGERIFPGEIEDVINAHPRVAESAVFGVPDPMLGEQILAAVASKPGQKIDPAQLREHCLKSLPFVRAPKEFRILESLPKTSNGKVDRKLLRSRLLDQAPRVEASD